MKIEICKILAVFLTISYQTEGLNETLLESLPGISESISLMNRQYRALAESTRREYHYQVEINNAALLSRIGFVAQDMKDFQAELMNDIQSRAVEINNTEAECILDAEQGLNISADLAGSVLMFAAREFIEEISLTNDVFVAPILSNIDHLTLLFEIELFVQLGFRNTVTDMEGIISFLVDEFLVFEDIFELFVSEIYIDFVIIDILSVERMELIFPILDNAFDDFRLNGNLIRDSLVNCN